MKIFRLIGFAVIIASSVTFSQTDSTNASRNLLVTGNFGSLELINLSTDIQLYSGVYLQLKVGKNLIPLKNDFIPKWASEYSIGIAYKLYYKHIAPMVSANYGYASWSVNKTDPSYSIVLPPGSAKLVVILAGFEMSASDNVVGGLSFGKIYWNYSNGFQDSKYGIQGYVGFFIW